MLETAALPGKMGATSRRFLGRAGAASLRAKIRENRKKRGKICIYGKNVVTLQAKTECRFFRKPNVGFP